MQPGKWFWECNLEDLNSKALLGGTASTLRKCAPNSAHGHLEFWKRVDTDRGHLTYPNIHPRPSPKLQWPDSLIYKTISRARNRISDLQVQATFLTLSGLFEPMVTPTVGRCPLLGQNTCCSTSYRTSLLHRCLSDNTLRVHPPPHRVWRIA